MQQDVKNRENSNSNSMNQSLEFKSMPEILTPTDNDQVTPLAKAMVPMHRSTGSPGKEHGTSPPQPLTGNQFRRNHGGGGAAASATSNSASGGSNSMLAATRCENQAIEFLKHNKFGSSSNTSSTTNSGTFTQPTGVKREEFLKYFRSLGPSSAPEGNEMQDQFVWDMFQIVVAASRITATTATPASTGQENLAQLTSLDVNRQLCESPSNQYLSTGSTNTQARNFALKDFKFGAPFSGNQSLTSFHEDMTPKVGTQNRDYRQGSRDQCGYEVLNDYTILDEIGSGSHGAVMLAIHSKTQNPFAVKAVPKNKKMKFGRSLPMTDVEREVAVMKKLRHKNIVSLYEVIDDPDEHMMYLIMDYVPNGPVLDPLSASAVHQQRMNATMPPEHGALRPEKEEVAKTQYEPLCEEKLVRYGKQIAEGLQYLHRRKVIHRDIKPDNILLGDNDNIFVSDFGVSDFWDASASNDLSGSESPSKSFSWKGTPAFCAPEVCSGLQAGPESDVWSFGVTLFAMRYGRVPFEGRDVPETVKLILGGKLEFPAIPEDDERHRNEHHWQDLISKMLLLEPNDRITLKALMRHKVFVSFTVRVPSTEVPPSPVKSSPMKSPSFKNSTEGGRSSTLGVSQDGTKDESEDVGEDEEDLIDFNVSLDSSPDETVISVRNQTRVAFFSEKFVRDVEKRRQSLGFVNELDPLFADRSVSPAGKKAVKSPQNRRTSRHFPGRRGTLQKELNLLE